MKEKIHIYGSTFEIARKMLNQLLIDNCQIGRINETCGNKSTVQITLEDGTIYKILPSMAENRSFECTKIYVDLDINDSLRWLLISPVLVSYGEDAINFFNKYDLELS